MSTANTRFTGKRGAAVGLSVMQQRILIVLLYETNSVVAAKRRAEAEGEDGWPDSPYYCGGPDDELWVFWGTARTTSCAPSPWPEKKWGIKSAQSFSRSLRSLEQRGLVG